MVKLEGFRDFQGLENKDAMNCSTPIPRFHKLLRKRKGYKYFTKFHISMQYCTFELDNESQDYCVIATPFVLY